MKKKSNSQTRRSPDPITVRDWATTPEGAATIQEAIETGKKAARHWKDSMTIDPRKLERPFR